MNYDIMPPVAEKKVKRIKVHGHVREDAYYWMNDRKSRMVAEHLKQENAYCKAVMSDISPLAEKIFREIRSRIKEDDDSVPYKKGEYYYYERHEKGKEYPIYCRKKDSLENTEEIICDMNEYAGDHSYFSGRIAISPDNRRFALTVDRVGRFLYSVIIKDMDTGSQDIASLENLSGQIVWAEDNEHILSVEKDPVTLRAWRVLSYSIKSCRTSCLYEEKDPAFSVHLEKSADRRFIFIICRSTLSSEIHYISSADLSKAELFSPRRRDLLYQVDSMNDRFFIRASFDRRNFELLCAQYGRTAEKSWQSIIPYRRNTDIEDMVLFSEYLVLSERQEGLVNLRILSYDLKTDYNEDFGLEAYHTYIMDTNESGSNLLRYSVQSLNTPPEIYEHDLRDNKKYLRKRKRVKAGFTPDNYQVRRIFIRARDGVMVPVSLVYRKNCFSKGKNPLFIRAYGSYGYPSDPGFDNSLVSILDRGFVCALAHVRGGGDMGREWYEDGKLHRKKNTFYDFIDCTRGLLREGYGRKDMVFGMGGSAGGLLIGAVANISGGLYKALIPSVPFVDVVTTMLDDTIPLTTFEYDEWGNPRNKNDYEYMLSYSPYDNVQARAYPHMYILSGFHDSQVQYWEPAKWAAKLREMKTSDSLVLFECDMASGHGGPSGRYRGIKRTARVWAFMLDLTGIKE